MSFCNTPAPCCSKGETRLPEKSEMIGDIFQSNASALHQKAGANAARRAFFEGDDEAEETLLPESAPLHIAIDGTALYGIYGGVEYSLWNLLSALQKQNSPHRFTVFIPHDGPCDEQLAPFGSNWQWRRLPFKGSAKARRIFWQQVQWPRTLRQETFDLLHAPTYVAPLKSPIPVVLGVYDLISLTHPAFATRTNRLHYGFVLPRALQSAAHVVVPTKAVRRDVEKFVSSQKISVVPLGVEAMFLQQRDAADLAAFRKRYNLPDEYFLFVGNFEPKKNIPALLQAHRLLCRKAGAPPLVVVGGARSWQGHEVAPQGEKVRLLGYVPRHELPLFYACCTAFVFPTLAEGFCLPVLEALAAGAPVITTNQVPLPGLEAVTLLCPPHDVEALAQIMQSLWKNPAQAALLRQKGRAYAAHFDWERAARQTLGVYETVCRTVGQGAKSASRFR